MRHEVYGEVDATVSALAQHIQQLVALTEDARDFPHDIDELSIGINIVRWVRSACSLLGGGWMMGCILTNIMRSNNLTCLVLASVGIILWYIVVNRGINSIIFLLLVRRMNIDTLGSDTA